MFSFLSIFRFFSTWCHLKFGFSASSNSANQIFFVSKVFSHFILPSQLFINSSWIGLLLFIIKAFETPVAIAILAPSYKTPLKNAEKGYGHKSNNFRFDKNLNKKKQKIYWINTFGTRNTSNLTCTSKLRWEVLGT